MTAPEVTFGEVGLDDRQRADVRHALRRIRFDVADGGWPSPVDHVEVTGVLSGGLSGALVLSADMHCGNHRLARVVKIDSPAELAAEWRSYVKLIKPVANALFAPIVAATPDIVTRSTTEWGPGAIVYDHAAQFSGRPEMPLRTLEDVVRAALGGSTAALEHALGAIGRLLHGAAHVLYNRCEPDPLPSTLRSMNPSLGPNVTLLVDAHREGTLHYGPSDPERGVLMWLPDDELLRRTIGSPESAQLVDGDDVALSHLRPVGAGQPLIARGDDIVVEIVSGGPGNPDWLAELAGRREFAVHGRVVGTRGSVHRARMVAAVQELGPSPATDDDWIVDGTVVADPFRALPGVLTRPVPHRVRSVIHGDLNPRNALIVGDQPCLIDYSHTEDGRPQQADFCWLELGLLREVFADLGFSALVVLQRWLALASLVLDLKPGDAAAPAVPTCVDLVGRRAPGLVVAFRVLLEIRRSGRLLHPASSGQPWHRDYFEQLLLAAHRTVKWTHAAQTSEKIRAAVAVASVATEQLADGNPFSRWTGPDLTAALTAVEPALPPSDDNSAALLHELATALPAGDVAAEGVLASARERLVRTRCADRARRLRVQLEEQHDEYVDLIAAPDGVDVVSLVLTEPRVILCGASGSGKTTVLHEVAHRLAAGILGPRGTGSIPVRLPVLVDAAELVRQLASGPTEVVRAVLADSGLAGIAAAAFELGALWLLVDNLDRLGPEEQHSALAWLAEQSRQYPRLRMLISGRELGEQDRFAARVVRLRELDVAGMRMFLYRALAAERMRGSDIEHLLRLLLEEPEWQRLRPERPGVLALVVRHVRRSGRPDGVMTAGDIIAERMFGTGSSGTPPADELASVCERIATWLLDERADDIPAELVRQHVTPDPNDLLEHLVSRDVLHRVHDRLAFVDPTYRDHFAARALRRNPSVAPVDRVLQPNWHAAVRVFVTLPGVAEARDLLLELVHAAWSVAPVLAAHLMRDTLIDDDSLAVPFVEAQRAVLADDTAGDEEVSEAAAALAALGGLGSRNVLSSVVVDSGYRAGSRSAALRSIAALDRRTTAGRRSTGSLVTAVTRLLAEPCPVPLRVAALDVITANGLRGLELFVGRCVTPTEPWPVVCAAVRTLHALRVAVPTPLVEVHQVACRRRLTELDGLLGELTVVGEARRHQDERAHLLSLLSGPDATAVLLKHRFDFQAGPSSAVRLDEVLEAVSPDPRPAYWSILVGDMAGDEWVRAVVDGDPVEATAAAHRLLRDAPSMAVRALAGIDVDAPVHRLLIAAALVSAAGSAGLDHAERLFRDLLPVVDGERLAGFAALLCAIVVARPELGVRLAWTAADALADRDLAERHRWPWAAALARCQGGGAELERLLDADDESAALAESALASRAFPRHCLAGRNLMFGQSTRQRMLSRAPDAGSSEWECGRWALAAANMDLVEALPALRAIASGMVDRAGVMAMGTAHSGLVSRAPLADVLAVLGYLARRASADPAESVRADDEVLETHRLLSDLDTQDSHVSIRTGRLIGLAYLGDCAPLVRAVIAGRSIGQWGHNAIRLWTPGPCTPQAFRDDVDLARWLGGQRDRPGLPATARTVLAQLTREVERRAGVLIPRSAVIVAATTLIGTRSRT